MDFFGVFLIILKNDYATTTQQTLVLARWGMIRVANNLTPGAVPALCFAIDPSGIVAAATADLAVQGVTGFLAIVRIGVEALALAI